MTRKRFTLLILIVLLYLLSWRLSVFESNCLYHPDLAEFKNPSIALKTTSISKRVKDIYIHTNDGIQLNVWYIPATHRKETIVFAHGNGGNLANRIDILETFAKEGYGILAFDYRGYGNSQGSPEEKGLYQDMAAASHYLSRLGIPPSQQIAMGESIGSGVAVQAASKIPFKALVLFPAFTSTPDIAVFLRHRYGQDWLSALPVDLIMRQRFPSIQTITQVHCPLLIMHGTQDEMMPASMSQALIAKSPAQDKTLLLIQNADHNNVFWLGKEQLLSKLNQMLERVSSQK